MHFIAIAAIPFAYNTYGLAHAIFFNLLFDKFQITTLTSIDKIIFYETTFFYVQFSCTMMIILSCCYLPVSSLKNILQRSVSGTFIKSHSDILFKTSLVYEKVCDITSNFSQFFKFMIAPFFMIYLTYNLLFTYGLFVYQMNPNIQLRIFTTICLIWVSLYTPLVFCIYFFSSAIISESEEIISLVQLLAAKDRSQTSLKKGLNLALFFNHQKPQMTCELFDINWKTFAAFMGSTLTYTIILVQFYDVSNE